MALKSCTVDALVMGGVLETEFGGGEDTVDVGVPKAAGLGMTLEGMEDGAEGPFCDQGQCRIFPCTIQHRGHRC